MFKFNLTQAPEDQILTTAGKLIGVATVALVLILIIGLGGLLQ